MKRIDKGIFIVFILSLLFCALFMFTVEMTQATPEYNELEYTFFPASAPTNTWNTYNITNDLGIPKNSTAEIFIWNSHVDSNRILGVREVGSSFERKIVLGDSEVANPKNNARFLVNVDSSGNIQRYTSSTTSCGFGVIGYWTNVSFIEQWDSHFVTTAQDDMWYELTTGLSTQANKTHLINMLNRDTGKEELVGVRNTTSTLNRYIMLMKSESGGNHTYSMFVKSDVSGNIEVYTEQYNDHMFINQGYFDSLNFKEDFFEYIPTGGDGVWADWDLTGYMDIKGRNVDIIHSNINPNSGELAGTRLNGEMYNRRYYLKEAEGGGYSSGSWTTSTDENGVLETYSGDDTFVRFHYTGYFVPTNYTTPITPSASPKVNGLFDAWTEYNVSSVHVIRGTYVSGDLTSLEFNDTDYYLVDEVTGVEGFDVRFNFTDIPDTILSLSHRVRCEYEGNPAHDVDIELWNFISGAWIDSIHLPEHAFQWNNESMSLNSIDFNDGGDVWLRIVHHTSGVDTHYLNVDYFQLRGFIPASAGGGGLIWGIGAIFISVPILLILSYVLRRK